MLRYLVIKIYSKFLLILLVILNELFFKMESFCLIYLLLLMWNKIGFFWVGLICKLMVF